MLGRVAVLLLVAFAVALAPFAAAKSSRSFPIRLGVGIGPVNLGMTEEQVRASLGRPHAVLERKTISGQRYVEFQWNYGDWNVGFTGRKGERRVVLVGTGLARHRTPQGLGVGSSEREVTRRLPGVRLRTCHRQRSQWYYRRGDAETIFLPWHKPRRIEVGYPKLEVGAVEVRAPIMIGCVV